MKKLFTLVALCIACLTASAQFTEGIYMLTEGWYGNTSGDVYTFNYSDVAFNTPTFKSINGVSLGETGVFATVYGDNAYLVSKQDGSFGGAILAIVDAQTLKLKKYFSLNDLNNDGFYYDGHTFCGVSEKIGYLGTSNGIYVIDLANMVKLKFIEATRSDATYGGELIQDGNEYYEVDRYANQIGSMVRVGDYVFASQQNRGIHVINAETHEIETTILAAAVNSEFGSFTDLVLAKDGSLWTAPCGYYNWTWYDEPALPYLVRIDPYTLETKIVDIPTDIDMVNDNWSTYRPNVLQALKSANRLVWRMNDPSDYSSGASRICYYDIDTNTFGIFADITSDGYYSMYSGLSVDPENDIVWTVGSTSSYGGNSGILGYNSATGTNLCNVAITQFSGYEDYATMLFFTDDYAPEFNVSSKTMEVGDNFVTNLTDIVSDKDNMDAGIIVSANSSDTSVATAEVSGGKLTINAVGSGSTKIALYALSNGKTAETTMTVTVNALPTSIDEVIDDVEPVEYYNLQGVKVETPEKGIFLRKQGGKTTKVVL